SRCRARGRAGESPARRRGSTANTRSALRPLGAPCGRGGWCLLRFRDAEMPDLSLGLEPHHGADRILAPHGVVASMDTIEVDGVGAEALEALLAGFDDVIRVALGSGLPVG